MSEAARALPDPGPFHVAIIMDGNGRWARSRGLPRIAGHRAGASAVRRAVEAAPALGVRVLTLYAFSSDNWGRPRAEVDGLFDLFRTYLAKESEECGRRGVRIRVVGRRDRLPDDLLRAIEKAEERTAAGTRLLLRLAVDYSARDAILRAARSLSSCPDATRESFAARLEDPERPSAPVEDVDLLIRTGGERRLSDFLLWECAYAELFFTATPWPEFDGDELTAAVEEFRSRERRFGRIAPEGVS